MGNHRSAASGAGDDKMPVFKGARQPLECLERLARRPRRREAPASAGKTRGVQGIPLVCLKRADDGGALVEGLARYLKEAEPRRIPHVVHRCVPPPPGADDLDDMAGGLLRIARELASGPNAAGGRIRFSRFGLVHWLIHQDLGADHIDSDGLLRRRLRDRELSSSRYASLFSDELPEFLDAPVARWAKLARIVPPLWFMVRLSGRVPGIGREYRWLLRQPYLEPQDPGTVLGFGVRLTEGRRDAEEPEEVLLLLVKAFLADLAHAYRRSFWHPRGARRTSYPVVLLDNAAEGGFLLQHLVQEIRSHPRRTFDPLVLVAAAETFPPDALSGGTGSGVVRWAASEAVDGYEAWCRRGAGRSRNEDAWHLLISVPPVEARPAAGADDEQYAALWHAANNARRLEVVAPPAWSRAGVAPAVAALLVGILAGGFAVRPPGKGESVEVAGPAVSLPAKTVPTPVPSSGELTACRTVAGARWHVQGHQESPGPAECIGVADRTAAFAPRDSTMKALDRKIVAQNKRADALKNEYSERPVATLVYASSYRNRSDADHLSQKLEIAGYLAAQKEQNEDHRGENWPIYKILLANAGEGMEQHSLMVRKLGEARQADPTIVSVVGLEASTQATQDLIHELDGTGMPLVSATLSANGLGDDVENYFHIAALNSEQAAIIGRYGKLRAEARRGHLPRKVAVVCPADPGNLYSQTLQTELRKTFEGLDWDVTVYAYDPDSSETQSGAEGDAAADQACGPGAEKIGNPRKLAGVLGQQGPQLVVFAGRGADFELFLKGDASRLDIIATDDVSSVVARRNDNGSMDKNTFSYVSLAYGGGRDNAEAAGLAEYLELPGMTEIRADIDGHAPLAQRAASAVLDAAHDVLAAGKPLTPGTVQEELQKQSRDLESRTGASYGQLDGSNSHTDCRICIMRATPDRHVEMDKLMRGKQTKR